MLSISGILIVMLFSIPIKNSQSYIGQGQDSSFTVVLFEYHAPGAYRLLQIDETGMCEYVQFQRSIQQFRLGKLDSACLDTLMYDLASKSFDLLEDKYDVYPADPTLPPVVYEDTYFLLSVTKSGQTKKVLAHEHAAPDIMKQIVKKLFLFGRNLPNQSIDGLFLLLTESEIASKIRWLKPAEGSEVKFNNDTLSQYPDFEKAVLKPGWLYAIRSLEAAGLQKFFVGDATRFDLDYRGKKLTACILKGKK